MADYPWKGGLYKGTVVGQRFGKSQKKGTPYLEFSCKLEGKYDPDGSTLLSEEFPEGKVVNVQYYLTDDAAHIAVEALQTLGYTGSFTQLQPGAVGHQDLSGTPVKLWHKAADKWYQNWTISNPQRASEWKPKESNPKVAADAAAKFDALLKGGPAPKQEQAKPETPPTQKVAPAEEAEASSANWDEIPF